MVIGIGRWVRCLIALAGASCADHSTPTPVTEQATSSGSSGAGPAAPADPPCVPPPGLTGWSPMADSCWRTVGWSSPCQSTTGSLEGIELAEQPELAVPPLEWEACPGDRPGCTQVKALWDYEPDWKATGHATALKTELGYRVGLLLNWTAYPNRQFRAAVYDEAGKPLVVWRTTATNCILVAPRIGPARVWFGVNGSDGSGFRGAWISEPWDALGTAMITAPTSQLGQSQLSSDDLLSLWGLDGFTMTMVDAVTGTVTTFGEQGYFPVYYPFLPVGDAAFGKRYLDPQVPKGCVWTRRTGTVDDLVAPEREVVPDIHSDGTTLVWIQTPPHDPVNHHYPAGAIYTSPHVTNAAALRPTPGRPTPPVGAVAGAAGDGFYAFAGHVEYTVELGSLVHVVRLADMQYWSFRTPPGGHEVFAIDYVDRDEVWYLTPTRVFRQRIEALGPGEPRPP